MSDSELTPDRTRAVIEALLLTAEEPVPLARLVEVLDGVNTRDARHAVETLKQHYDQSGHGFTIAEVAGGYQLATRPELVAWVRRLHRGRSRVRLSQAALEALAIVAFKQPITRVEVDSIRGVSSAGVLQTLMELDMLRIVGRSDGIGKPMLFGTTKEFLIHFGLNSLNDLPKPKELEELLAQGERRAQEKSQLALGLDGREASPGPGEEAVAAGDDDTTGTTEESGGLPQDADEVRTADAGESDREESDPKKYEADEVDTEEGESGDSDPVAPAASGAHEGHPEGNGRHPA